MKYLVLDLLAVKEEMGPHWNPREKDWYEAACKCDTRVSQIENVCPNCSIAIIWRNSKAWRNRFGPASAAENLISRTPADEYGKFICKLAEVKAFPSTYALRRWNTLLDTQAMEAIVDAAGVAGRILKAQNGRPSALISILLNVAEKAGRERPTEIAIVEDYEL